MLKKIVAAALAAAVVITAGCASGGGEDSKVSRTLYVRGVFTWWDAEPEFQAKMIEANLWTASAELVADGNPYEWKFADGAWSAGTNFGYEKSGDFDGTIKVGVENKVAVNPNSAFENLKFTPEKDGVFNFFLDWRGEKPYTYIEIAK